MHDINGQFIRDKVFMSMGEAAHLVLENRKYFLAMDRIVDGYQSGLNNIRQNQTEKSACINQELLMQLGQAVKNELRDPQNRFLMSAVVENFKKHKLIVQLSDDEGYLAEEPDIPDYMHVEHTRKTFKNHDFGTALSAVIAARTYKI